jgi:hypothetical protein
LERDDVQRQPSVAVRPDAPGAQETLPG